MDLHYEIKQHYWSYKMCCVTCYLIFQFLYSLNVVCPNSSNGKIFQENRPLLTHLRLDVENNYHRYTSELKMQDIFILQENYTLTHTVKTEHTGKISSYSNKTTLVHNLVFPFWKHNLAPFILGPSIVSFRYSYREAKWVLFSYMQRNIWVFLFCV